MRFKAKLTIPLSTCLKKFKNRQNQKKTSEFYWVYLNEKFILPVNTFLNIFHIVPGLIISYFN